MGIDPVLTWRVQRFVLDRKSHTLSLMLKSDDVIGLLVEWPCDAMDMRAHLPAARTY